MSPLQVSSTSIQGILGSLATFPIFAYVFSMLKDVIMNLMKTGPVPKHIALIMDGNRRYAKQKNLPLKDGHTAGAESLILVLNVCYRLGVAVVTVYAFSIENFNRSQEEVDTLFGLLRDRLSALASSENSYARMNKIRIKIIGNKSMIPEDILADLEKIEQETNSPHVTQILNVCFPYTSRDDVVHAMQNAALDYQNGKIKKTHITEQVLEDYMYMGPESPPLDLLIRTSGHTRLSDYMLWQCGSECTIEFVDTLWPDFKFLSITSILLKWGYFKTLELERAAVVGVKRKKREPRVPLSLLPPPPPFASVSER